MFVGSTGDKLRGLINSVFFLSIMKQHLGPYNLPRRQEEDSTLEYEEKGFDELTPATPLNIKFHGY